MIKTTTLLLPAFLLGGDVLAQSECADYHKFDCPAARDKRFSLNGQSKSAAVQIGRQTELNIIVYRGQDYRIALCHDAAVLGPELAVRLVEKVRQPVEVTEEVVSEEDVLDGEGQPTGEKREVRTTRKKRVFEDVEKVLWDNSEHEMVQEVEFSCTSTKRLSIEINATGGSEDDRGRNSDFDIGCVGVRVEHMATPVVGFEPKSR